MKNIALIMMQKDEEHLFWPWMQYHGRKFGYENCYVFDNGSTNPLVLGQLAKAEELGANIDYQHSEVHDFVHKNKVFLEKINDLRKRGHYSVYFPLDCDEFVGFWNGSDVSLSEDLVRHHLEEVWKEGDYYLRVSMRYMNSPLERDQFYRSAMQKVVILAGSRSGKVGHGFHMKSLEDQYVIPTRLVYVEFHNRPHAQFIQSAKRKLAPFLSEFSEEALVNFKGPGHHLTKYCLMSEEQYVRRTHTQKELLQIGMSAEFHRLGVKYPFLDEVER